MLRRPPRSTRTDTRFPYTTLFRSARGEALRVVQGAEAYKERLENEAEGEAQRFLSVFEAYRQNPDIARRRMYLETMQGVLSQTDKVILDGEAGAGGAVPYLPLNELRRSSGAAPSPLPADNRSEARRVGKEGVSTFRSRWSPYT